MKRTPYSRSIRPLTEFRTKTAEFVELARVNPGPIVLTHRGRPVAALLGIEAYDRLMDELATLRDIGVSEAEVAAGADDAHERVNARLRASFAP